MNQFRHCRFRFNTRQALLLTLAVAVGMTIASGWHFGLLAVVSVMAIAGLLSDVRALRRYERVGLLADNDLRFSLRFAVIWRLTLAAILAFTLTAKVLLVRGLIDLPKDEFRFYEDPLTGYLLWLALGLALVVGLKAPQSRRTAVWRTAIDVTVVAAAVALGRYIIEDAWCVPYLVHLICEDVDAALINATHRYGVTALSDRRLYDAASFVLAIAVVAAALAWVGAEKLPRNRRGWRATLGIVAGAFLAVAATISYWFYFLAFPKLSPDAAEAGLCSSWWRRLGGLAIGALLTAAIAHRGCTGPTENEAPPLEIPVPRAFHRSLLAGLLLSLSSLSLFALAARECIDNGWESGAYFLLDSNNYLSFALLVLGLCIVWRRLCRADDEVIEVRPLSARAFFLAWGAAALWLIVAVPSLAASGCLSWHGTWFLE